MSEPQNGLELLKEIRKKNGKKIQSYSAITDYIDRKAREKGVPIHGQFELTPLCNFDCKMCYVHMDAKQMAGMEVMSVEGWKDLMHQAFEAGMLYANLTGGECLAYPGFEELFLYLHSLGCEVVVLTNGYLLDESRIEFFKKHMPVAIQITLYGWNDDVYERVTGKRVFGTVVKNIRNAIDAGLPVEIYITPSVFLGEDVFETIRIAREITKKVYISATLFDPREETGRSGKKYESDVDLYVRIYRMMNEMDGIDTKEIAEDKLPPIGGSCHKCDQCGLMCGGGRSNFTVTWKGTLIPCNRLDVICAYPLKDGFMEAWRHINQEANKWPHVPECEGCAYEDVCNYCAADMLPYAEPGKQPIELCERTRYFAQQGLLTLPECKK